MSRNLKRKKLVTALNAETEMKREKRQLAAKKATRTRAKKKAK